MFVNPLQTLNICRLFFHRVYASPVAGPNMRPFGCCSALSVAVLYGCGGKLLAANLIFMVAMSAWVAALSFAALCAIKYFVGLRVPMDVEEIGMDKSRHARHNKSSVALRRALRSASGKDDRSSAGSSHRPSFKSSRADSPRNFSARTTLAHWKD